jgi:class 3 adenylate cyclase/streptogramin lyase
VSGATSSGTKGFLFCDLRGYTAFVERRGDAAAAALLIAYRELVRSVIERHEGAEIRTEGDSFYVVFPTASGAVEAGLEIVARAGEQTTPELPIRVGVGVHAGETVASTAGLVGGAVNIAARVCAKAGAGEVLVTDTVRALTRTFLSYTYTSLGTQQLKGIVGGIPLYRVDAVAVSRTDRLRRQLSARRGRVALGLGLAAVVLVAAGGFVIANRGPDCLTLSTSTNDVVARIDPARDCVVETASVGRRPRAIVATSRGIWVANQDDWTLTSVDAGTGATRTVGVGGDPIALAVDPADDVYALVHDDKTEGMDRFGTSRSIGDRAAEVTGNDGRLALLRPIVGCDPNAPNARYEGIAFSGSQLWVVRSETAGLVRMSAAGCLPATAGSSQLPVDMTGPIAAGLGAIWIGSTSSPTLYRVSSGSTDLTPVPLGAGGGVLALALTDRLVWLVRSGGDLTRFDPVDGSLARIAIDAPASAIAATSTDVWVVEPANGAVARLSVETGRPTATIRVGGQPAGIAIGTDGSVWVTLGAR